MTKEMPVYNKGLAIAGGKWLIEMFPINWDKLCFYFISMQPKNLLFSVLHSSFL